MASSALRCVSLAMPHAYPATGSRVHRHGSPKRRRPGGVLPVGDTVGVMAKASDDFLCVLRAWSRANGLGALLKTFPRWKPDNAWRAGTRDVSGRIRSHNGFNLFVTDGGEWKHVIRATRRWLRAMAPMIAMGREFGASFQLDIVVMVGRRFYTEARFDPADLALLSTLGVELCISAYPVSEQ